MTASLISFFSLLQRSADKCAGGIGGGGWGWGGDKKNWSKSIVLENKVLLNFDLGMDPKNQVVWITCSRVMAFFSERVH